MSKKTLTTEELQNKVGQLTAEIAELFDKALGEESYSCYVNIAWEQPVTSQPETTQRICLVCTPETDSPTMTGDSSAS